MTERRKNLIAELVTVQNHPSNWNRDILTITGFMTDAEIEAHLRRCRMQALSLRVIDQAA